ncbi:MAG: hypothetical protein KKD31_18050, partial [Bacteroidetes bacterium]|nr:hypothetical protein [Bacteroidota bacterium]
EKARLDSIAKVETEKAAAEQLRVADSLAAVAAEQQRVTDSILAATEAAAKKGTGKPKKTEQQKSTETKVSGKGH